MANKLNLRYFEKLVQPNFSAWIFRVEVVISHQKIQIKENLDAPHSICKKIFEENIGKDL